MKQYIDLVQSILDTGHYRQDRTGVGTLSTFGHVLQFDLRQAFPIVSVKSTNYKAAFAELEGFLTGVQSAAQFRDLGTKIWDANANDPGLPDSPNHWLTNPNRQGTDDLGRIYGAQWNDWRGPTGKSINQLQEMIDGLRDNPWSRRHLVSAWNPGELDRMALPPCHYAFQCWRTEAELSMIVHMRSVDVFLGLPFNIVSYAALMHWVAKQVGDLEPRRLVMTLGDTHLYVNHINGARKMLTRSPAPYSARLCPTGDQVSKWEIADYSPREAIHAPMAV